MTTTPVHYRPGDDTRDWWVGDVIPFAYGDRVWLYYLLEQRDDPSSGTGWALVTTDDFVSYDDHGVVLPSGGPTAEDYNCYTGSLVDDGEQLHLFYTGNNPEVRAPDGTPLQQVMHAVSSDGLDWTKLPADTFAAPEPYEPGDWRDPFVFREHAGAPWRMLLAARHRDGAPRRRGTIAQLTSTDLTTWALAEPSWDPRRFVAHECPDVFAIGDRWYLVYSEFSDAFVTRYRTAPTPAGPWTAPELDSVDGRAFYASKSVLHRGRRFFIGWIATREGETDDGAWQWAGTMSVLESSARADGTLDFFLPAELVDSFGQPDSSWARAARLEAPDGHAVAIGDALPASCRIRAVLDVEPGTRECGLLLRSSDDGDEAYVIRLEPFRNRVVFDRWPRRGTGPGQWQISGDVPYVIELERPCPLPPGRHTLDVIMDDTTCVIVIDHRVALSTRVYDRRAGRVGAFVTDGTLSVVELDVFTRPA